MLRNILVLGLFNCLVSQAAVAMEIDNYPTDPEQKTIATHIKTRIDDNLNILPPEGWQMGENTYSSRVENGMDPIGDVDCLSSATIEEFITQKTGKKTLTLERVSENRIKYKINCIPNVPNEHIECALEGILTKLDNTRLKTSTEQ